MSRASNTFSVLQATAAVASIAILLWSIGLPSIRFAEAASVTTFSDTLSTSEPSVAANHTITFTTPTGLTAGQAIQLTFESGFTGIASLVAADIDLDVDDGGVSNENLIDGAASGASWNVTSAGQDVTITSGTDTIGANATVTIRIGTNAVDEATGTNQITNPTGGSYTVNVDIGGGTDTGETRVAIVDTVTVSASVDTLFTFNVNGLAGGTAVSGSTTGGTTTPTTIPFGQLDAGVASTAAQELVVTTNARNGFVVTVEADGMLRSTNGADIDGFIDGAYTNTPTAWQSPGGTVGQENEYGHWGITSDDTDIFTSGQYVSASTTPVQVMDATGPTDGTGDGITNVGYGVEITALQEAGDDYQAILTYVATPVF